MTDPINPRGYTAAYERAQECTECGGVGHWHVGDELETEACGRCDGTGVEPAPDASPVTSEDVERALSRAEETTMARPDNTSIHRQGSIGKLAMRLVTDYAIPSDRAASVAEAINAVSPMWAVRQLLLACVLPLPTKDARDTAAKALLRECGFAP